MGHRLFGVGRPATTNEIYGLFWANAAFISQNFNGQTVGAGAINVNNVAEPVNAAHRVGHSRRRLRDVGNDQAHPASPSGIVMDMETASVVGDSSGLAYDLALASIVAEWHSTSDSDTIRII